MIGVPGDNGHYDVFEYDGVTVYITDNLNPVGGGPVVYLQRFLWMKLLGVKGVEVAFAGGTCSL
jgi:hypothetical protein